MNDPRKRSLQNARKRRMYRCTGAALAVTVLFLSMTQAGYAGTADGQSALTGETAAEAAPSAVAVEDVFSAEETALILPSSFDLRSVDTDGDGAGDRCYVTPIRLQRPLGDCWAFAATAAAETSLLGSVLKDDPEAYRTLDLSEKQLAYFAGTAINDPDHPQRGKECRP